MKISVTYEDTLFSLDISEDSEIEILKASLEFESGVPGSEFSIYYNGVSLKEMKKSLRYFGIKDGDVLVMTKRIPRPPPLDRSSEAPSIDWRNVRVPGTTSREHLITPNPGNSGNIDPLILREVILSDPYQRSLIRERNPPLSEALESGDPQRFVTVFTQQKKFRDEQEALKMRMIHADPMDIEAQQKIAEEIQQANINSNMETAMEFAPESFGQVIMLYINCLVNGKPVKAFVDSGAQMTIMSVACANRCNIMRLVDRRWAGLAKGVGTQKIIGRVHVAQIQIENDFLASSFSVLESQPMDMLLGLDMLKRHQCSIDLKENVLKIGTTGTATPFLSESELPDCARLSGNVNQEVEDRDLAEALNRSTQDVHSNSTSSASTSSGTGGQPTSSGTGGQPTSSGTGGQPASSGTGGQPTSASGLQSFLSSLPSNVSEEKIKSLVNMGFKREDIMKELEKNGGDMNKTTAILLTRSLKLPK